MRQLQILSTSILALLFLVIFFQSSSIAQALKDNNEVLFEHLQRAHDLPDEQMDSIRVIFRESGYIGQGNPAIARHPVTPQG